MNRARTRISRECRTVGLSVLQEDRQPGARSNDPASFTPAGRWIVAPRLWDDLTPERIVAGRQLWEHVRDAIEALPPNQRAVVVLRDREGRNSREICELLSISSENQRVLLHRARASIREVLDKLVGQSEAVRPGAPQPNRSPAVRALVLGGRTFRGSLKGPALRVIAGE